MDDNAPEVASLDWSGILAGVDRSRLDEVLRGLSESHTYTALGRLVVSFANLEERVKEAIFGIALNGVTGKVPMIVRAAIGELGYQRLVPLLAAATIEQRVTAKHGYEIKVREQPSEEIVALADKCDQLSKKVLEVWVDPASSAGGVTG